MEINSIPMQRLQPLQPSIAVTRVDELNRSGVGSGVRDTNQPSSTPAVARSSSNTIDPALLDYTETLRAVRAARFADQSASTQTTLQTPAATPPAANPQQVVVAAQPSAAPPESLRAAATASTPNPPVLNPEPTQPPPQGATPPPPTTATAPDPAANSRAVTPPPVVDATGSAPVAGGVSPNGANGGAPTVTPQSAANPATNSNSRNGRPNLPNGVSDPSSVVNAAQAAVELYRLNQTLLTPTSNREAGFRIDAMI